MEQPMENQDRRTQNANGRRTRARSIWASRARLAGLWLGVVLGLWPGSPPLASPRPRRAASPPYAGAEGPTPIAPLHWKALLLAGDDTSGVFDRAIEALAALVPQHHITVVQRFTADPTKVSATVRLATVAALRAATPQLQVQPGEGCLVYATSHGDRAGLTLARDPASGYRLRPTTLHRVVQVACGAAPTVLVLSGCYTGTFLRPPLLGPHRLILTAAAADRPSFGCGAQQQYTY
jgi:hypothetical protein